MQIQLLLPPNIRRQLIENLRKGGSQEIGGIMMGEHVSSNQFRILEITCELHSGSFAKFLRSTFGFLGPLKRFFKTTRYEYTRFNYLGEWHSHPSFALSPISRRRSESGCHIRQSPFGQIEPSGRLGVCPDRFFPADISRICRDRTRTITFYVTHAPTRSYSDCTGNESIGVADDD